MSRKIFGSGCALLLASTVFASAQSQPYPQSTASAPQASATVTVEGCLFREADVPGRQPPEGDRERVKRDDDYVLANAKMIKGSAPPAPSAPAREDTPTGTSSVTSAPRMYKVEEIDKDQLEQHKGSRVQIDGVLSNTEMAGNPVSPAMDLVKIRGTAIRAVTGDCASK